MKHFMLKFNHGVEIGAKLAYIGHFKRTGEAGIYKIIQEEEDHRRRLYCILQWHSETSNKFIDASFTLIGNTVAFFCKFSPIWSLDFIAKTMESFAVFNYNKLAIKYPYFSYDFHIMSRAEERHESYFSRVS